MIERIETDLTDMNYVPNNNQLGVAIAAKIKYAKKKKQLWIVPPGLGKSRIIAVIATIFKDKYDQLSRICIMFSS